MTSEVVLLNKSGIVIAADSAVTVGKDPHPRYSKSANKIFDASTHGSLAIAIYGAADVDQVPWELAVKQFRKEDSTNPQRPHTADYVDALFKFLEGRSLLFPASHLRDQFELKVMVAAMRIVEDVVDYAPSVKDTSIDVTARKQRWDEKFSMEKTDAEARTLAACLSDANYQKHHAMAGAIRDSVVKTAVPPELLGIVDNDALVSLAIDYLFKIPWYFLSSTGVVFAGYGSDDIFPSYTSVKVFGHIGDQLCHTPENSQAVSHSATAWIEPFAQSSMIQRFTDGFDYKQKTRLTKLLGKSMESLVKALTDAGSTIDPALAADLVGKAKSAAAAEWQSDNWAENFHPLRRVLASLSMPEMAELAETLLVLESLRERVTSPSESVGGPVDVAVITKAEGLVWVKRKHYFEADLNRRYLRRVGL